MYIVFMKDDANIFKSSFPTWEDARAYGRQMFGPGGYVIDRE